MNQSIYSYVIHKYSLSLPLYFLPQKRSKDLDHLNHYLVTTT